MSDGEVISDGEKTKIASDFILHAPPGEFNEVFTGLLPSTIETSSHLVKWMAPKNRYDHLKKEALDFQPADVDHSAEPWRAAVESELTSYHKTFYKYGVSSTYGTSSGGSVTIIACIESHQFQPKNFWNGRWRSQWTVTFPTSGGKTDLVHYYEDGNVQLALRRQLPVTRSKIDWNKILGYKVGTALSAQNKIK
ncbi:CAPZA-like protein [Mya arenaria]|uniref:F-actin-capping protein subunit alpha n=1 Tax=Mya arenaria TaxID=6604 RepID=A0ABY7FX21_MYAAR|nr:CAPZA-like protein [Mya arenaria]